MRNAVFYIFFSICIAFIFCGCKSKPETDFTGGKIYQCKNFELSLPIEIVDLETNGKKSGSTHFHSSSTESEVFYSYERFETDERAANQLKENQKPARRVLRNSEIKDSNGNQIGEKIVMATADGYVLLWTKEKMLNSLSSEFLAAIEEIEKDCNY